MVFSVVCMSLCPSFPFLEAYSHVWTFFGIAFLWDWNENWPLQVLWPLLSFQVCWHIECSTVTTSSFRIWNSSTGIPSPPLALSIEMLPEAHLTSHSRVSGSRWVMAHSFIELDKAVVHHTCLTGLYVELYKKMWVMHLGIISLSSLILRTQTILIALSPKARHSGMWSQVGLRKHHCEQS